jgi:phage tail-like protein
MPAIGANIGVSRAARQRDLRVDPFQASNFIVEIEGLIVGGFSECTGLEIELETEEYREGGQNDFLHRFVGATRHPRLVLKHGVSPIDGLWGWHQDVASGTIQRRNGTIHLLDQAQGPVRLWHFHEALPLKWTGPELRASGSAVAFESIELTHKGLTRERPTTADRAVATATIEFGRVRQLVGSFF